MNDKNMSNVKLKYNNQTSSYSRVEPFIYNFYTQCYD